MRWRKVKGYFRAQTLRRDAVAGLVLGVESVPDGLAIGVLAGVNPLAGLYAYLFGMAGAAFFTASAFVAVQATGAMSLIVSDAELNTYADPDRALFTLAILTGIVMVLAGLLRGGRLLRFVPTAVMTGFVTAVGVNIVLGQLPNLTGTNAEGSNRILRTIALFANPLAIDLPSLIVGLVTIAGVVFLVRTPLRSIGLVVAVVVGSALAALFTYVLGEPVIKVDDLVDVPSGLPGPVLPSISDIPTLIIPALSLAFVGLVQGAAVAAAFPNRDGRRVKSSRDFIAQGAGNILSGLFQGMPVGGSMSASAINVSAGARTRLSLLIAAAVMAIVILTLSPVVAFTAMPALAGLLIVMGVEAVKPSRIRSVVKTGPLQTTAMGVTFVLTLVVPLQFAVLVGVGLGLILYVVEESNRIRVRRQVLAEDGRIQEVAAPREVPPDEVLILQPYGSLFFASTPTFEGQLPAVTPATRNAVVIIRLRGVDQLGLSMIEVLRRYARELAVARSVLKLTVSSPRVMKQLKSTGLLAELGRENVYRSTEWLGQSLERAVADAREHIGIR
jgi:SulP family sulfate permease